MRGKKILAVILAILGTASAITAVSVAMSALYSHPVMLAQSAAAVSCADEMMQAVCRGDYPSAGELMYGSPKLGTRPDPDEEAVTLIWDAFIDSIEYEFTGECYAVDSGVALDMNIRTLDITGITGTIGTYSGEMLNERVTQAEDISEIYDEKNNYREDMVKEILRDATVMALERDARYQEREITLQLIYDEGQWWVMPGAELLNVLAGSLAG